MIFPLRSSHPDPVGEFWLSRAPRGSTAWVFARMTLEDRVDVASTCFRDAKFDVFGNLDCTCPGHTFWGYRNGAFGGRTYGNRQCQEEYLCELLANELLMPREAFLQDLAEMLDADFEPQAIVRALACMYMMGPGKFERGKVLHRVLTLTNL